MIFDRKAFIRALVVIGLLVVTSGVSLAQKKPAPTAERKIIACIKNEDVRCVSEFLTGGGDPRAVDDDGLPILIVASEGKSTSIIRLLISAGADVNVRSDDSTPLCRAALFGRKEIAQTLLEAGAKATVICDSDHGDSALMEAVRGAMLSDLPDEMKASIFSSEETGDGDDKEDVDGKSAKARELLKVTSDDYLETAQLLLAKNADVNVVATCDAGETALLYAAMGANVTLVKSLLSHGADVTRGGPIIDFLRGFENEYQQAKLVQLPTLSRQQAAMIDWTEKNRTRSEEIVRLLMAAGARETETDITENEVKKDAEAYAREAFQEAIEGNDLEDFERLLKAYNNHPLGAIVLPNALRVAVIYSRIEMVKLLLKYGVDPNIPSTALVYTPLMQAASSGNLDLVKLLIEAGAELNAEDSSGRTALDAANMYTSSSEEHRMVVAFLKARGARRGQKKK